MPSEIPEYVVTAVYCLDFDEKFEPPSCHVEAFRGESYQVDGVLFRCFEVVDPPIYVGQDLRASSRQVVYPSPMLFGSGALFG